MNWLSRFVDKYGDLVIILLVFLFGLFCLYDIVWGH